MSYVSLGLLYIVNHMICRLQAAKKTRDGGPVRRQGRSVAFAVQQGGRPFVLQRRVVAAGAPRCAAKCSGAPMSPSPVSPP